MSLNKVLLIGRLGKDPELRYTQSNTPVCNFRLATMEKYAGKDGSSPSEKTEWHSIIVWGKLAETCAQYLQKGAQAFIEGRITTREFEKDGVKRSSTEVIAHNIQFLGDRASAASAGSSTSARAETKVLAKPTVDAYDLGDIPF